MADPSLEQRCVNTIRGLAMDAVQKAKSGHPGMPLGMADAAFVLWTRFLRHDPKDPGWSNRDRFVLSAGHGSMLLYSLLYLTGYDLPMEELQRFRQWGSMTPGHPEYREAPGVEATTGPLGQGFGMGVGLALAERMLAARFNRPGFCLVDHYTYSIVSDGDLMEGISHEAASLAGHLGLGKLIYLYDDNRITIEGSTELTYSDDVTGRFEAYGWHVLEVDGHDREAVAQALQAAQAEAEQPSLIRCHTHIGFGSPNKQDTAAAHGEPLGEEEVRLTKEALGWPVEPGFYVPDDVAEYFASLRPGWAEAGTQWRELSARYRTAYPDLGFQWDQATEGDLPLGWQSALPTFEPGQSLATRAASGAVLSAIMSALPTLVGGSADLAPSTKTYVKGFGAVGPGRFDGRNLHFGVREHAMGALLNGMALHGGVRPYGGTFLVFSDYMRPSIRLAAMMGLPVVYVFTHDSIYVGEDGPTHQPIEHLASLRAIPRLVTIRPADAAETVEAWQVALERREGPTALILTRQGVPVLDRTSTAAAAGLRRGGYILAGEGAPQVVLIGSGSELHVALGALHLLAEEGFRARVVSLPSWELFDAQDEAYRDDVLPPSVPKVALEAGVPLGWERYVGRRRGRVVAIRGRFGASAPAKVVGERYGFTPEAIADAAKALLQVQ